MAEVHSSDGECWKSVPGWPWYLVSNRGRVYSKRKKRLLSPKGSSGKGHLFLELSAGRGTVRTFGVHQLVLLAHSGPRPEGMECRHLDGNPQNNHVENLRWGTRTENCIDRIVHGTGPAKLTDDAVREIRKRLAAGEKIVPLGHEFGVSHVSISNIRSGRTWSHLP